MAKRVYQKAKQGERMIELKVCFWTDGFAEKGYIWPEHAWTRGEVRIVRNDAHGIEPARGSKFNSLMEIPSAIEKVLVDHGVELHLCSKMDRYVKQG